MAVDTSHNSIHPQRQVARKVGNAFAFPELALPGPEKYRPCAELPDGNFKGDARPQRWFLENQRKVFSRECKVAVIPPQVGGR
jgi:hypothetical protein